MSRSFGVTRPGQALLLLHQDVLSLLSLALPFGASYPLKFLTKLPLSLPTTLWSDSVWLKIDAMLVRQKDPAIHYAHVQI